MKESGAVGYNMVAVSRMWLLKCKFMNVTALVPQVR